MFITLEDESGVSNSVVMPDMFQRERAAIVTNQWLLIEGPLLNVDHVIHVVARKIFPLRCGATADISHAFR